MVLVTDPEKILEKLKQAQADLYSLKDKVARLLDAGTEWREARRLGMHYERVVAEAKLAEVLESFSSEDSS